MAAASAAVTLKPMEDTMSNELKKVTKKLPAKAAKTTKSTKTSKKPAKKAGTPKGKSSLVATGKYRTVRQLADELFGKKKDKLTFEELEKAVHSNFKGSKFSKNDYGWLKYHILTKGEKGKRTA